MRRPQTAGQSLLIIALLLPVIVGLWLLAIELAWRVATVQAVTDALRAANRSAVQHFDYAAFAENRLALADPNTVIATARQLATINLTGIIGLVQSPAEIADATQWTVLPAGGVCVLEPAGPPLHFPSPALCSATQIDLLSPLDLTMTIEVYAADTLDLSAMPANP